MTALRICCSSPATSVPPPAFLSCDQAALPNDNVKMRQQIQILFIGTSTLFFWKQTNFSPRVQACQISGDSLYHFLVVSELGSFVEKSSSGILPLALSS